ncbi:hypothetical protein CYMTET_41623 [Cymbomonas tetramitiformis]|uniref:Uncharacterized protein n=1 Tax=Cymbomonas tetramitiformis TaxID=36881 RepID=A0AAE0F225_9CHLO|nr:hypothetical protein CYMTET_41623 [Cymbomonas tetramitiformis]
MVENLQGTSTVSVVSPAGAALQHDGKLQRGRKVGETARFGTAQFCNLVPGVSGRFFLATEESFVDAVTSETVLEYQHCATLTGGDFVTFNTSTGETLGRKQLLRPYCVDQQFNNAFVYGSTDDEASLKFAFPGSAQDLDSYEAGRIYMLHFAEGVEPTTVLANGFSLATIPYSSGGGITDLATTLMTAETWAFVSSIDSSTLASKSRVFETRSIESIAYSDFYVILVGTPGALDVFTVGGEKASAADSRNWSDLTEAPTTAAVLPVRTAQFCNLVPNVSGTFYLKDNVFSETFVSSNTPISYKECKILTGGRLVMFKATNGQSTAWIEFETGYFLEQQFNNIFVYGNGKHEFSLQLGFPISQSELAGNEGRLFVLHYAHGVEPVQIEIDQERLEGGSIAYPSGSALSRSTVDLLATKQLRYFSSIDSATLATLENIFSGETANSLSQNNYYVALVGQSDAPDIFTVSGQKAATLSPTAATSTPTSSYLKPTSSTVHGTSKASCISFVHGLPFVALLRLLQK